MGVLLAIAALVGAVVGWIIAASASRGRHEIDEARLLRDRERDQGERAIARLRRQLEEIEVRERDQGEIFQILPELVRQMFAATGRRDVLPLALKLLHQTFHPEMAAIFLARPDLRRLTLSVGLGLPPTLTPGLEVEYGQGRVGYVGANRLAMDEADFKGATALMRVQIEAEATALKELRVDAAAPLEGEGELIGVLCVGGMRVRQTQAKRLLKLVADLTGIAFVHVARLRRTQDAADRDGLTQVFNKRYLQKRLGDEIHKAENDHTPLSLLILDIDHFKNYNDTSGHLEGDEVLKKIGEMLRDAIREEDVAARYGGEEFIILYPRASKSQALSLAEELRQTVADYGFAHGARQPGGRVTISGGVATFPEDSRSAVDLIRAADQALYDAKAAGRNRIIGASQNYLT